MEERTYSTPITDEYVQDTLEEATDGEDVNAAVFDNAIDWYDNYSYRLCVEFIEQVKVNVKEQLYPGYPLTEGYYYWKKKSLGSGAVMVPLIYSGTLVDDTLHPVRVKNWVDKLDRNTDILVKNKYNIHIPHFGAWKVQVKYKVIQRKENYKSKPPRFNFTYAYLWGVMENGNPAKGIRPRPVLKHTLMLFTDVLPNNKDRWDDVLDAMKKGNDPPDIMNLGSEENE